MSRGLAVSVCRTCGKAVFPPRALCPACGGASWRREWAREGVVEEVTEAGGVPLASVRLDAGPVVVARLDGEPGQGGRVRLLAADGAPVAL